MHTLVKSRVDQLPRQRETYWYIPLSKLQNRIIYSVDIENAVVRLVAR